MKILFFYIDTQALKNAGVNTLVGMVTVFVVLILISLIISCFKVIPYLEEKLKKKTEIVLPETTVEECVEYETEDVDDLEVVAVITAALMAYLGEETPNDGLVVRNIRRRKYK